MTRPPATSPRRQRLALFYSTLLLFTLAAAVPLRAATARDLYNVALAHERDLRTPGDQPVPLEQLRDAIAAYEDIVRQFPRSGYSDNALWQAAGLAFQAFDSHRQAADRDAAVRLLRMLESEYPTSALLPGVTDRLEQIGFLDEPVRIRAIRREALADIVRVTIDLDDEVPYRSKRLDGPARLFFDLSGTYAPPPLRDATLTFDDSDLVREIRLGRHPGQTTRVVLDIEEVDSFSVYTLYNPYRIVVDTVPTESRQARRTTPQMPADSPVADDVVPPRTDRVDEPVSVEPTQSRPTPVGSAVTVDSPPTLLSDEAPSTPSLLSGPDLLPVPKGWKVRRVERLAPTVSPAPNRAEATAPDPAGEWFTHTPEPRPGAATPIANSDGNYSLARQLGLGVSRIVIDPGHGGHDPGAQTGELTESALVLDVARRLEARLKATTDIEVILTRRRDTFLPLGARPEIANRVQADLFLSIHANAAKDHSARGIETYYLDLATDPNSRKVAARENAASRQHMHDLPQLARSITAYSKMDESRDLAEMVQRNLIRNVRDLHPEAQDLGVKQAPFVVLLGANMPSVLAEISFLTNQADAAFLATDAYRDRIADALLQSILEYQLALKPTTSSVSFPVDAEDDD